MTDLSIIVVNWNTREMTRDCLQSVFDGLGDLDAEVILVDNASEDGSADMVAADFPQAVLIRNDRNLGFAAANNQAMKVARGRQILLLNSDTLVHGAVLPQSVQWLDAQPEVGAMACRVMNTDGTEQLNNTIFPTPWRQFLYLSGLFKVIGHGAVRGIGPEGPAQKVESVAGCYLLVRREVIEQVGLLDEAFFFFGEETDWCRRMRDAGWTLMLAPVGEITHFQGGSAKRLNYRRNIMLCQANVRLNRKHGGLLAAVVSYAIVVAHNASRALVWSIAALAGSSDRAREKASVFRAVLWHSGDIWPGPV